MFAQIGTVITALTGVVLTLGTVLSTRARFRDNEGTSMPRQPPNRPVPPIPPIPPIPPMGPMPPNFDRVKRNARRHLRQHQSGGVGSISVQAGGNLSIGNMSINVGPLGPQSNPRTPDQATGPAQAHQYAIETRRRARENARVAARKLDTARSLGHRRAARGRIFGAVAVPAWLTMIVAGAVSPTGTNNAVSGIAFLVALITSVVAVYAGVAYAVAARSLGELSDLASTAADQLSYADGDVERYRAAALVAGVPVHELPAE